MTGPMTGKAGEAELHALLRAHGIGWVRHTHPPLHTVEESRQLRGELPGAHVKNMFLKDRKEQLWLVTCLEDRQIRIRDLEKEIGARKCSFGKPDLMWEVLGLRPGAVSPLGLINDRARRIRVVLDARMMTQEVINLHPLHNEATTALTMADFRRFLEITGHVPLLVDFDALEAQARAHSPA